MDEYQQRYVEHQQRKKKELTATKPILPRIQDEDRVGFQRVLLARQSSRVFGSDVNESDVDALLESLNHIPSSCDRRGVSVWPVTEREDKEILSGLLVGGVGWLYRAHTVLLLLADPLAYKAPGEVEFMPYLDAGVVVQTLYLSAASRNLACCYVNPNVRDQNKIFFNHRFARNKIFCGAFAIGSA